MRIVALALLVAACGGDDGNNGKMDGGGSGSGSGSGIDDAIVGMWNKAPGADPMYAFDSVKFGSDGSVLEKTSGKADSMGTFTLPSSGEVSITTTGGGSNSGTIQTQYVATADHLMLTAFFPKGTVNGYVGMWENKTTSNGTMETVDFTVNNDMTAVFTLTPASGQGMTYNGTWATDPTGIMFTVAGGIVTFHFTGINNNQAIGYLYYVKA
ncbi:MAG: hypothetical protein QM831_26155 [Kofleriaceae bacterium]